MTNAESVAALDCRTNPIHYLGNALNQPQEDGKYWPPAERLSPPKGAGELRSKFLFSFLPKGFVKPRNASPMASGEVRHIGHLSYFAVITWNDDDLLEVRHDMSEVALHLLVFKSGRGDKRLHTNDELVFVRNVKRMKQKEFAVPVRIGFGLAYCFDDLFSGEVYFSHSDDRFKTVRFLTKGELDSIGLQGAEWRDYLPDELVEGGVEVMNSVSDDKCEFWRDGVMLPELKPAFSYFGVCNERQATSVSRKELPVFRMEIIDVLYRASNF